MSTLCQNCGLCCDGSLFEVVRIAPDELEAVSAHLPIERHDTEAPRMKQPCTALAGSVCQAYERRPKACRAYRCNLLIAAEEKEVSIPEALEVVREAQRRITEVDELLPESAVGDGSALYRASRALQRGVPGARGQALRRLRAEAEAFLDQHFRGRSRQG